MEEVSASSTSAAGAAIYTPLILRFGYDFVVLFFSNTWAWRCSTKKTQLPFFQKHLEHSSSHLDIGVGTGYYLAHANISPNTKLTLLDLNQNSLEVANRRIQGRGQLILGDATQPLEVTERFDSISLFYLLHCMPGPCHSKASLFKNLKHYLSPDGILYGTTILGKGVEHNFIGRFLMRFYNERGIFGNLDDNRLEFENALNEVFEVVETRVEGVVLLFSASKPRTRLTGTV